MGAAASGHPTDQTLRSYGLGMLDDTSADSVIKHLKSCALCQRRVAEVTSDTFLGRLRENQARPDSPPPVGSSFSGLSSSAGKASAHAFSAAATLPPGLAEHPDYEIVRELGRGGMGVVYLAYNKLMGRNEVLKVVSRELMDRRGVLDRFLREIRNAAQLHHPNVVTAYSAIRVGESMVFAMEYVEGYDLAQLVKGKGALSVPHASNFTYQVALGLQYAHEKGMVHRDIKPSNLMLALQGKKPIVKILDFGLAKATREGSLDGGLTHEGQMLGTPDYIAPEQSLDAQKADIRADIYSLGCTLYYLLSGGPPFRGSSLYEVLRAHQAIEPKPLNLVRPEVPCELAAVVAKMMAKDPGRRYQTPGEAASAVKPFFKTGQPLAVGTHPEISSSGRSTPAQATEDGGTKGLKSASGPPIAPLASLPTAESQAVRPAWDIPIDISEAGDPSGELRTPQGAQDHGSRALVWISGAACIMALGVFVGWRITSGVSKDETASDKLASATRSQPEELESSDSTAPSDGTGARTHDELAGATRASERLSTGTGNPSKHPVGSQSAQPRSKPPEPPVPNAPRDPSSLGAELKSKRLAAKGADGRATSDSEPPPRERATAGPKDVATGGTAPSFEIRLVRPVPGLERLPDRDAEAPDQAFWPPLTPSKLTHWRIGAPGHVRLRGKGMQIEAGPSGNLLLTQKETYKKCMIKLTLAANKGTEAFLALRARFGQEGWQAATVRIHGREDGIYVGNQSLNFAEGKSSRRVAEAAPGKPFQVTFQINEKNVSSLMVKQRETPSVNYDDPAVADSIGSVGVFVKSGAVLIERLDVPDL
jgi:serine/threonine protein kinase